MSHTRRPIKFLFGPNRSGTTWLGSVLNAHPEIAYRFEPFHRLRDKPEIRSFIHAIHTSDTSNESTNELYMALLSADPVLDKPPFFRKVWSNELFKSSLYGPCRLLPVLSRLYRQLYTPPVNTPVLIKDVTCERHIAPLLKNTRLPIVYLVRHPVATVLSLTRGQISGQMGVNRLNVLDQSIKYHNSDLYEEYRSRLDSMSLLQKNALFWKIDVEKAIAAISGFETDQAMVIVYENLCTDPHLYTDKILNFYGLSTTREVTAFLTGLCELNEPKNNKNVRFKKNSNYFSIMHNPMSQKDAWRTTAQDSEIDAVYQIVKDSFAFQKLAELGGWS